MPRQYYMTELSVGPPVPISTETIDDYVFTFNPVNEEGVDSGLTAVTAEVEVRDLATLLELTDETLTISTPDDNTSVVHVDAAALGLQRGEHYEMLVRFILSDNTTDEGTLVFSVVA